MRPTKSMTLADATPADRSAASDVGEIAPTRKADSPAGASPYALLDIVQRASASKRFTTLARAIRLAGLGRFLKGRGPFTLFAPTDEAFGKMAPEDRAALLGDTTMLAEVLAHHVVTSRVKPPKKGAPSSAMPMYGRELTIERQDLAFTVDKARLVKTGIRASNGVIHAIDTVLMMPR